MSATTEELKPHLSASAMDTYCRCPEAYRRSYIEKEKIPPMVAALRGRGMHHGAKVNFTQKMETHVDLPARDIIDAGIAQYETEVAGGLTLDYEEASRGAKVVVAESKDLLHHVLGFHAQEQAPHYQPILVEHFVRLELSGPRDLVGVIDVATTSVVADFKNAKRSKSQGDVESSIQLTTYAAMYKAETGELPKAVALDTIVTLKKETRRQLLISDRNEADLLALRNRINAINHAIDAGSFPPAAPGSWNCSDRWCGYYRTCPFVNGGRGTQND